VNQVGEERNRPGDDEDDGLRKRGDAEHAEAQEDGLDPLA
jgi:hypothetical protein